MIASLPPRKSAFEQSGKLLTVDQVTHLARATQQYELYVSVRADLTIELGRTPTDEELAEQLELPGGAREYRRRVRASLRAKNLLVQSNLKLVYSVARRFTNQGLAFQDLVQEGSLGMLRAAELFDPDRGIKISTYATWWITQAIRRAIANGARDIRVPVHAQDGLRKMRMVRGELYADLGRSPTQAEIAERMGVPVRKLVFLEDVRPMVTRPPISIETQLSCTQGAGDGQSPLTLMNTLRASPTAVPDIAVEQADLAAQVHALLETELTELEAATLRLRFGLPEKGQGEPQDQCTLDEAGKRLGVGRDKVRKAEVRAMRKLRACSGRDALRPYAQLP